MAGVTRHHERINASVPVRIEGGGRGETTNLSPAGVHFVTDQPLRDGTAIRFSIEFYAPAGSFFLECVGEVVRVENANGQTGIAARITESQLHRRQRATAPTATTATTATTGAPA